MGNEETWEFLDEVEKFGRYLFEELLQDAALLFTHDDIKSKFEVCLKGIRPHKFQVSCHMQVFLHDISPPRLPRTLWQTLPHTQPHTLLLTLPCTLPCIRPFRITFPGREAVKLSTLAMVTVSLHSIHYIHKQKKSHHRRFQLVIRNVLVLF